MESSNQPSWVWVLACWPLPPPLSQYHFLSIYCEVWLTPLQQKIHRKMKHNCWCHTRGNKKWVLVVWRKIIFGIRGEWATWFKMIEMQINTQVQRNTMYELMGWSNGVGGCICCTLWSLRSIKNCLNTTVFTIHSTLLVYCCYLELTPSSYLLTKKDNIPCNKA